MHNAFKTDNIRPPSAATQVLYRAAKARFDEDEAFKTRAREAVTRLQGGDPAALEAWGRICGASRAEFQKIYDRLGVELEERGESFYNPFLEVRGRFGCWFWRRGRSFFFFVAVSASGLNHNASARTPPF